MSKIHEKRKARRKAFKAWVNGDKKKLKPGPENEPFTCTHEHYTPLSYVNKDEALKIFSEHDMKAEYTKYMDDGTQRWYWTLRDKDYNKIGFILGVPSIDQKQGNHSHNDPFKSDFDYMEIRQREVLKTHNDYKEE